MLQCVSAETAAMVQMGEHSEQNLKDNAQSPAFFRELVVDEKLLERIYRFVRQRCN